MTDIDQICDYASHGVGRLGVEAMIGRKMTDDELVVFRKAEAKRKIELAEKKKRGPMTSAERVRKHVASANEIGDFNVRPRHQRLKESCRYDLYRFIRFYCQPVLRHLPSERIRNGLIKVVQETILHGGQSVKQYGRGTGKTTIIVTCGITWAALYGHRHYPVIIGASAKVAKKNLKSVKKLITRSKEIFQDFPAISIPLSAIGEVSQRTASQTYHGRPTDTVWGSDQIVLPTLKDDYGNLLDDGCGVIVGCVGIGGAIRGANEGGQRPDFLIIDDPQTKKIAHSPKMVEDVINYIHQDALMLSGHDRRLSAFVTITPQCFGDVATELCSRTKHPEWDVSIEPFVCRKCPKWDQLLLAYVEQYVEDAANHDSRFSRSRAWYVEHKEDFAGVEVIDPLQYDTENEIDAVHHVLNLRAILGEKAFNAEIMMEVSDTGSSVAIDAEMVANALNGAPRNVCPPGTDSVVAFCDVNITNTRGLSCAVVAFGPKRVAALVNKIRYPERGPLVPPNSSDLVRNKLVAAGMKVIIEKVAALPIRDSKGRKVQITALAFDRGYLPAVVHRVLYVVRKTKPVPFQLVAMRGFPWNKFGVREKDMLRRGDHVFATRSQYGQYLAEMAPYWREKMQASFLETPLMPGSFSLWGSDPVEHYEFANEICAEKLIRRYLVEQKGRTETAWDWQTLGENHWCDSCTGCFALASWYHLYDNLSAVIDGVITTPGGMAFKTVQAIQEHVVHQDDLFDPMKNKAVVEAAAYDGAKDETEGTCDPDVEPFAGDVENTTDPLTEASSVRPLVRRKVPAKVLKQIHRFKKGRYRR